jgi:hypothetical protein
MLDKVVFTQDTMGEREWLKSLFPNHNYRETSDSGLWENKDFNHLKPNLFEVPYCSSSTGIDIDNAEYFKSIFNVGSFDDRNWMNADHLITTLPFKQFNNSKNKYYQILTLGRSGTQFLESILQQRFKEFKPHIQTGAGISNLEWKAFANDCQKTKNVSLFYLYRKDWWNWFTSFLLLTKSEISVHFDTISKFDNYNTSFEILESNMIFFLNLVKTTFNQWCNLRSILNDFECGIMEFSHNVNEYGIFSKHKKIPYSKENFFTNYNTAKQLFNDKYLKYFKLYEKRMLNHLLSMNCKMNIKKEELLLCH